MKIGTFINHGTVVEIESVQTMNLHIDKGQVCFGEHGLQEVIASQTAEEDLDAPEELPDALCTPQAEALLAKLCDAGMLDARWQPVGLSFSEKGTLIDYIAEKLGIRSKWKLFGTLWNDDAETLRTSKARGLEQESTWSFRSRLEAL
jgi:hypothetical protein